MEWQDIKDAPKDGTVINFISITNGNVVLQGTCSWSKLRLPIDEAIYWTWIDCTRKVIVAPTHWLPLTEDKGIDIKEKIKLNFHWREHNNGLLFDLIVGTKYLGFIKKSEDPDDIYKYRGYFDLKYWYSDFPVNYNSLEQGKAFVEKYVTEWVTDILK